MSLIETRDASTRLSDPGRASARRPGAGLASALPWLCVLTVTLLVDALFELASGPTAVTIALLGVVHSAFGFVRHGGTRITPPGVFLFGMLLFGYFPTLYYAWAEGDFIPVPYEIRGLAAMLAIQVVLYAAWSIPDRRVASDLRQPAPTSAWLPGVILGIITLLVGIAIISFDVEGLLPLSRPAGYAGVVLAAVSLVQRRRRLQPLVLIGVGALFGIFVASLFTGGGRLVLGSLALALTMAIGLVWRPSFVKPAILASLPPGLAFLAHIRAVSVANPITGYQESGMESVVWPQRLFFQVLGDSGSGRFALGYEETFLASALSWVPREVWADKPVGFGTTLTELYRPHLLSAGHSEAALVYGEFVYSFSPWGLLVGAVVIGLAISWLDGRIADMHGRSATATGTLIAQAIGLVLTAGLVDLVWVGTFSYVSRAGFACVILGILWIVTKLLRLDDMGAAGRDAAHPKNSVSTRLGRRRSRDTIRSRQGPASQRAPSGIGGG